VGKQTINTGASANDGTGDPLRTAWIKANGNFDELYAESEDALEASEDIAAADFVSIHASSGAKIRKAGATDGARPVDGYCPAAIASAASGTVKMPGRVISGLSGLTPGATYYLSTTPGLITVTAPSGSGNLVQQVGKALSATELKFWPSEGVVL
jgi:hypothetical protein